MLYLCLWRGYQPRGGPPSRSKSAPVHTPEAPMIEPRPYPPSVAELPVKKTILMSLMTIEKNNLSVGSETFSRNTK